MTDLERTRERTPVPKDWTYAPAPEARDIVRIEKRYGHYVGGDWIEPSETYTTISPPDDDPRFISPITMDPTDPTHIATVGQEVWETNNGFDTTTKDWHKSFNMKFPNQGTALSVQGSSLYVGACGPCNPSDFSHVTPFQNSLWTNTNVGQGNNWHQAKANGLPNRYISAIVHDPSNP